MAEALVDVVAKELSTKLGGIASVPLHPIAKVLAGDILAAIDAAGYAVVPKEEPSQQIEENGISP